MQRVLKLVIKACLIFLFSNNSMGQTNYDNYVLLNKVIILTKQKKHNTYKLLKSIGSNTDKLDKYYRFKYFKKPIYKIASGYDEETNSIIYNDSLNQKKREYIWKKKYSILDSLFTKMDIEYMLQQNENQLWTWDEDKLGDNIDISSDNSLSYGNKIYKPLYSLSGEHAIVLHESLKSFMSFFIFKKEKSDWIIIDSILNIW